MIVEFAIWGIVGLFLINESQEVLSLLKDESHEVRAMAAWLLIKTDNHRDEGYACLIQLLQENSYATLKVLNIIDWMEEKGQSLISTVEKLDFSETNDERYKTQVQQYVRSKYE